MEIGAAYARGAGEGGFRLPRNKSRSIEKKIVDKQVLNCYYRTNTDSILGGESPPVA
jgi:hypothetical protein